MPRLFTGIEIPAEIGLALSAYRGGLPGAAGSILKTITSLCASSATSTIAWRRRCIPFSATRAAATRSRSPSTVSTVSAGLKPRAVFARTSGNGEMNEMQAEQERLMRQLGLEPETRKFTPHITLARLRNASPLDVGGLHRDTRPFSES